MDIVTDRKLRAMFLRVRPEGLDTRLSATAAGSLVMSRSSHVAASTQARFRPQADPLRAAGAVSPPVVVPQWSFRYRDGGRSTKDDRICLCADGFDWLGHLLD